MLVKVSVFEQSGASVAVVAIDDASCFVKAGCGNAAEVYDCVEEVVYHIGRVLALNELWVMRCGIFAL